MIERPLTSVPSHTVGVLPEYSSAYGGLLRELYSRRRDHFMGLQRQCAGACRHGLLLLNKASFRKHFRAYAEAAELMDNNPLHARDYSHNPGGAWSVSPRQLTHITVIVAKC